MFCKCCRIMNKLPGQSFPSQEIYIDTPEGLNQPEGGAVGNSFLAHPFSDNEMCLNTLKIRQCVGYKADLEID